MRIVIAGAGEVGTHLAKMLSQEDQDITLIDKSFERLNSADSSMSVITQQGNPISFNVLENANVRNCELFIAVTPYETENIISCEIAKSLGAEKTVARIDNYEFMDPAKREVFTRAGVNTVIYPEYLAAKKIQSALTHPWVRDWFEMHDGKIIVVGVKIRENAEIVGMQLKDFAARERNFHVSAIRRRQEIIIPTGNDTIEDGDVVYFTTMAEYIEELRELCGKKLHNIRNIMIVGACRIAIRLLKLLENDDRYHLKVIDPVREQCLKISELYPGIDVVCGDYRNIDFLKDEGLLKTDAFIALSDNAEINILSCLAAKDKGVKKAVAQVESLQLMPLADQNNISTIINKKLLASSAIFQLLLDIDSNDSRCLALADAEVAEIEAMPNSKITHKLVKDLSLPRGEMTLAALIRDGVGYFINGFTQIMTGDRVVIFCRQGSLSKIEKLFK